ncbi:MAG: hypothetical protein E7191_07775, partial [Erysipelotrichaceae bacterium]|nr:hypothetical protein [Erysipelotrichaceae bacterium]
MKKVRLFAVAAAMGMFASTVAAAEPVVSTSYTTTWGEVDTIIKVDVGDKVVAPTTTIKVVKETRTTDTEEKPYLDGLGFEDLEDCYTANGAADDDNNDNYSDVQIYVNGTEGGYYASKLDAVKDYLYDNKLIVVPGEEEVKEDVYYAKYANKTFADYEEVYAWLEEQGLVKSVYDEDGDLTKIIVKETVITDSKGREVATARYEIAVGAREEDAKKEAVVNKCVDQANGVGGFAKILVNYTRQQEENEDTYAFKGTWVQTPGQAASEGTINPGAIVIVDEYKGELNIEGVYYSAADAAAAGYTTGWDHNTTPATAIGPKPTTDRITVYEVVSKKGEVVKKSTIKPTVVKAFTQPADMVWDEEVGSFVKTVKEFENFTTSIDGYWYNHEWEDEDSTEGTFTPDDVKIRTATLGLTTIEYNKYFDNTTGKWLLNVPYTSLNTKEGKVTLSYNDGDKEVVVNAVEVDKYTWMPAFDSEEELVKVASKIDLPENAGHKFTVGDEYGELSDTYLNAANPVAVTDFEKWYEATELLVKNPWSGYTQDGKTPKNELRGAGSEACAYVVAETSEEVEATITSNADAVDTSVAGVKTLTLTAKVGEEVV